jgi:dihydroneopterin aldolase
MAKIVLEGMEFYAFHGYYPEETAIGGRFVVDVWIDTDFTTAAQTDALGHTVNYEVVYNIVACAMKKPAKLLETVGFGIKSDILQAFGGLCTDDLLVRISKYNPPLGGKVLRTYIEV